MEINLEELNLQKEKIEEEIIAKLLFPLLITSKKTRKIVYANPYAQKQYETTLNDLVGLSIDTFYTHNDQRETILNSFNENGSVEKLELSFKTKKGKVFYGLLSVIDITFKGEDCYLGIVSDITIQKQQQFELEKLNKELNDYKTHLEDKVKEEVKKREESERILAQKSKLAAMGEMIDAIAHQWKQPLNAINLLVYMLKHDFDDGKLNEDKITNFLDRFNKQKTHMLNTLNEFRSFFRPNKAIQQFEVNKTIESVLLLMKDDLMRFCIKVETITKNNFTINGNENEFKHIILNIINNAKDAFEENNIEEKKISITSYTTNEFDIIEIKDNAGGIPELIIDDIFKANVTSKMEEKGTGIGLYISKQILEKIQGVIEVKNIENGAVFFIKIPKNT